MTRRYHELTFTPHVIAAQERDGGRKAAARMQASEWPDRELSDREAQFIAERDSFYMATVGEDGWPYAQHRGGPKGFLHVLDARTIGFADYRGNRQNISVGHLDHDDRVAMILVDYPNRRRLKVMAHARVLDPADHPELHSRLANDNDPHAERLVLLQIEAFDWNCPQHITPRYTLQEIMELSAQADGSTEDGLMDSDTSSIFQRIQVNTSMITQKKGIIFPRPSILAKPSDASGCSSTMIGLVRSVLGS